MDKGREEKKIEKKEITMEIMKELIGTYIEMHHR